MVSDKAKQELREKSTSDQTDFMMDLFKYTDKDQNGYLTLDEVRGLHKRLSEDLEKDDFDQLELTEEDCEDAFRRMDRNGDGKVGLIEFGRFMVPYFV
ncbi:hypothetical protein BDV25DRAFT_137254 [Aspergillus avenaceus]|uniref:EF-hand domain-containing protein n=1 Tax=Aspergillus avenaceus TaxID=36643 RepID=A0A5N6U366_ASPAV|nr:hypothetical protein BDV25DRAFT_137254 [Aspergillus avenaceus]